jgi:predicted small secreted protein
MKNRLYVIIAVVILSTFVLSACGVAGQLTDVSDRGKAFMAALRDADHATSWSMLTPAVQEEVGSYDAWVSFATPRNFDTFSFSSNNIENNSAQLDGEATLAGETYLVTLVFDKSGNQWFVSGINFSLK